MKKATVLFILLIHSFLPGTVPLYAENSEPFLDKFSFTMGQLNDNIPCPYKCAIDGWSIGPDDQYTFSMVSHIKYDKFSLRSDLIVVTSRLFEYRFDFLNISMGYSLPFNSGAGDIRLGLIGRGNFGGEFMQNLWHEKVIGYPTLILPYKETEFGIHIGAGIAYDLLKLKNNSILLQGYGDIDYYSASGPNSIKIGLNAFFHTVFFDVESIIGFEYHFLLEHALNDLMENGLYGAIVLSLKPLKYFGCTFGFGLFPVKNVTDDPNFKDKEYSVTTQFWYLFTLGKESPKIRSSPLP